MWESDINLLFVYHVIGDVMIMTWIEIHFFFVVFIAQPTAIPARLGTLVPGSNKLSSDYFVIFLLLFWPP